MSQTGGDFNWTWWLGIGLVFAVINFIYWYFFRKPWTPPADALFVDGGASVFVKRPWERKFGWWTPVWVTDKELNSGALDDPVPLTSIRSVREIMWNRRAEPVIELECDLGNRHETIQIAVRDWRKLKSLLESAQGPQVSGKERT